MPNLTSVTLTSGLGTGGTGTISTLDNLMGTAGTANTNVLSVQGIASGTAQPVSGTVTANAGTNLNTSTLALEAGGNLAKLPLAQASTTSGQSGPLVQAAVTTSAPSYTTAQTSPLSLDVTGRLRTTAIASNETSTVYNGTTACTPLFAKVVASSSGATEIIAIVSSKSIRVLAMQLTASAAVNVKWQSHVTPTDLTGLAYLAANGGYVLPYNPVGWFQTISGEALDINLSASNAVGGSITYITV